MTVDQQMAKLFDDFLARPHGEVMKPSPLSGFGMYFVVFGRLHRVIPQLAVAIAGRETSYGVDPKAGIDVTVKFNAWGYGPHNTFKSFEDGIYTVNRRFSQLLTQNNGKLRELVRVWVNGPQSTKYEPQYESTVAAVIKQLGASPLHLSTPVLIRP